MKLLNLESIMETLFQDLRFSVRMLRKSPGFALASIAILALGIGMNTAIFTLIDGVLFRSLPITNPQQLFVLRWSAQQLPKNHSYGSFGFCAENFTKTNPSGCSLSLPFFNAIQSQTNVFSSVAAFNPAGRIDLSGNGPATMVDAEYVSGTYFQMLGLKAAAGRLIAPGDDAASAPAVAVISYGYWQRAFGGSQSVIGQQVRLNNVPFTIVGVVEGKFTSLGLGQRSLWIPLSQRPRLIPYWTAKVDDAGSWWLDIIARLQPGVTPRQASTAASLLFRNETFPGEKPLFQPGDGQAITLQPVPDALRDAQKSGLTPLMILMALVGVVLLISCANIAGLLLARAAAREKEIGVRLSLGATRARLTLQLLTESVLLSALGGSSGILLAVWSSRSLLAYIARANPKGFSAAIQLDWRILAFTAGISLVTGILFGLAPGLRAARVNLISSLKLGESGGATSTGSRRHWFAPGNLLVVAQVSLAVVVLVSAGLLVRTLANLRDLDLGFDPHNVLLFGIDPTLAGYKNAREDNIYRELQEKFASVPGVISVSYSQRGLLAGGYGTTTVRIPGTGEVRSDILPVGPRFFATMRIPLQRGQEFTQADFTSATENSAANPTSTPSSVVVNETFARRYFAKVDPLGQHLDPSGSGDLLPTPGWRVIGVVRDAKSFNLRREVHPTMYVPVKRTGTVFELRTAMDPTSVAPAVRDVVNQTDSNLALNNVTTQSAQIDSGLLQERIVAQLSSSFGMLALVLACVGLYGLLSYEVTRRTREIGIRMAMGAQQIDVITTVLRQAAILVLAGALIGTAISLGVTRLLGTFLYGVSSSDPATLVAVIVLMAVVALVGCYIPARRASKVDPMVALRYE